MRLMLSRLVLVVLLGAAAVSPVYADTSYTGAFIRNNESINCDTCSNNTSGLQVKQHTVFAQSPKIITIGMGYYADHPIGYNSQTGKHTWIKSRAAGVSMNHEVSSAHNLNQTLDMSALDSYYQDEYTMAANGGIQMKVAEDVQEGKVSVGVLQGDKSWNDHSLSATALRNPSLDIEEDYVGNFHIEKNMTLQVPIRRLLQNYSWLPCCSVDYFDVKDHNSGYIGEESVFDYSR